MKKFLPIFFAIFFISSQSNATGLFVGADLLSATVAHKAKNNTNFASDPKNGNVQEDDSINYGINAGVRVDFLNLLASGEVFYDRLRTSARNFETTSGAINHSERINLDDRYGVKANLGFAILPKLTPFITYGFTNINYSTKISTASLHKPTNMTPLYGVGLLFDVPFLDLSIKASYDYQQFNMRYADADTKIKTHLGVARIGLVYNF